MHIVFGIMLIVHALITLAISAGSFAPQQNIPNPRLATLVAVPARAVLDIPGYRVARRSDLVGRGCAAPWRGARFLRIPYSSRMVDTASDRRGDPWSDSADHLLPPLLSPRRASQHRHPVGRAGRRAAAGFVDGRVLRHLGLLGVPEGAARVIDPRTQESPTVVNGGAVDQMCAEVVRRGPAMGECPESRLHRPWGSRRVRRGPRRRCRLPGPTHPLPTLEARPYRAPHQVPTHLTWDSFL